jgi:hypothetical protein
VYSDLLLHLQQQEADEDSKADAKHGGDSKDSDGRTRSFISREESDGTYDMDVIPSKRNLGGSKDEPGLDKILEDEVNKMSTKARSIHK